MFSVTGTQPAALEELQAQILEVLAQGESTITLDLDPLPQLDVQALRGLIVLLRRVRDAGGRVTLHVTRGDLLRTLHVTALDRVFPIAEAAA